MELAHSADDGLTGLLVLADGEGRVFVGQLLDGRRELLLVVLRPGLDGHVDDGVREGHRLQDDGLVDRAQSIARRRLLETDEGVDVAGMRGLHRVLAIGVHLEHLPDALLLALRGVEHLHALTHLAGVDADVGELAVEGVDGDLEGEGCEGLVLVRLAGVGLVLAAGEEALRGGDVERRGQVVHDPVEHGLDALVLVGRTAEDGVDLAGDRADAQSPLDLVEGELAAFEVLLHELLVGFGRGLDRFEVVGLRLLQEVGRNLLLGDDDALRVLALGVFLREADRLHLQDVDHAVEVALDPDREGHDDRRGLKAVLDRLD